MHWYHSILVIGALVAGGLARDLPRAWLWIGLGATSFVASSLWHDAGLPYGAAFGAATNLAICLLLYAWAERRFEMRIWNCFHLMILIDILYLAGWIKSHYVFAVALELANWLALVVIGAAGLMEMARLHGYLSRPVHSGLLDRVYRALHAKRKAPPFWNVR